METTTDTEPQITLLRWENTPRPTRHTATAAEHAEWRLPAGDRFIHTSWLCDDNGHEYGLETVEISRDAAMGLLTQAIADGADPDWNRHEDIILIDPEMFGAKRWWDCITLRPAV